MHTHPFTPQMDTSPTPGPAAGVQPPAHPCAGGHSGGSCCTVGPGAPHRIRVTGVLLEVEGLSLLPGRRFATGSWSCFPGMAQQLWAEPVGTGCSRRLLSPWLRAPDLACSGRPSAPVPSEGRRAGRGLDASRFARQPGCEGDGAPNPHSAPVALHRAQSSDCPCPCLPHSGGARLPVPGPLTSRLCLPLSSQPSWECQVSDGDLRIYF